LVDWTRWAAAARSSRSSSKCVYLEWDQVEGKKEEYL
jgi:hypothetical protein